MKYALVNGLKTESQPGMRGTCINCQSGTLAKCGQVKIWHWAHKSKRSCDPWWENETEWHRAWKNRFPVEWQEKIHTDPVTGEKHIADVKTASELVIEFQHSAIQPSEIKSREAFYTNMVWVVDGTRLKRDYPRFCKSFSDLRPAGVAGFFRSFFPDECLPASWLTSSVPVYFDFQSSNPVDQKDERRSVLWCLFPDRIEGHAILAGVRREQFMEYSSTAPHLLLAREHLDHISQLSQLQRERSANAATQGKYLHAHSQYARRRFRL